MIAITLAKTELEEAISHICYFYPYLSSAKWIKHIVGLSYSHFILKTIILYNLMHITY